MEKKTSYRILVVDDEPSIRELLRAYLNSPYYHVIEAKDGMEGLEKANRIKPDLIISDIIMPNMDGITFCQEVRHEATINMTPFIFLTAMESEDIAFDGFRAGADEFFIKSELDDKKLLDSIANLIERNHILTQSNYQPQTGFTSRFIDLRIMDFIDLLMQNHHSGILKILSSGKQGTLYFFNGSPVDAECKSNDQALTGKEAITEICGWENGSISFNSLKAAGVEPHQTSSLDSILKSYSDVQEIKEMAETNSLFLDRDQEALNWKTIQEFVDILDEGDNIAITRVLRDGDAQILTGTLAYKLKNEFGIKVKEGNAVYEIEFKKEDTDIVHIELLN